MSISRTWRRTAAIEPHNVLLDAIQPFESMIVCRKMNIRIHLCRMPQCEYFRKCHAGEGVKL